MGEVLGSLKRTHYCGDITKNDIGKTVTVCGWVQKSRDKGTLIFVDLRDRTGIVQLAFDSDTPQNLKEKAQSVRSEYVLATKGIVRERESKNDKLANGDIEIFVNELRILSTSETPPFEITDKTNVNEELRLRYRYLDLRRSEMQYYIKMRYLITKLTRDYFGKNGFIEIETPTLIKSTPEGARDYLVPSRVQSGKFFALPQSPQLYKQLLMLSGFDRYMQIARCYRDEDLRADRQPEFTQIDLEMSFVDQEDIISIVSGFVRFVAKELLGVELPTEFKRLTYAQAMNTYGSDKPDTRFDMKITQLDECFTSTQFVVFSNVLNSGGTVRGIVVKNAAEKLSRKEIDKLTTFVKDFGASGLAFTRLSEAGSSSSFEKNLSEPELQAYRKYLNLQNGDVALIIADKPKIVLSALGALRNHLAEKLELIQPNTLDILWVTDFPMFEYSETENRYTAMHHPFTSPNPEDVDILLTEPEKCRAIAYDMVINGYEIGGGSIRISDRSIQEKTFQALGFSQEEANKRFGFLLDAFRYGVPPHGGLALGLERLCMVLLQTKNIKDVIAFPKIQNSSELMTGCPAEVPLENLNELNIAVLSK